MHVDIPEWDDQGQWWHIFPARAMASKRGFARTFHRIATAYIAAARSGADHGDADMGPACKGVLRTLDERRVGGKVSMSAIIHSFEHCPADLFSDTLTLLRWVGHMKSLNTLQPYKYACMLAVKAYVNHQCRKVAHPSEKVGMQSHSCVCRVLKGRFVRECVVY